MVWILLLGTTVLIVVFVDVLIFEVFQIFKEPKNARHLPFWLLLFGLSLIPAFVFLLLSFHKLI